MNDQVEGIEMTGDLKVEEVPCPFVYKGGKQCQGHIIGVEAFKADLAWSRKDDGSWRFGWGRPRSHFHLRCSLKDNHAGFGRPDSEGLKMYYDQLPESLRRIVDAELALKPVSPA